MYSTASFDAYSADARGENIQYALSTLHRSRAIAPTTSDPPRTGVRRLEPVAQSSPTAARTNANERMLPALSSPALSYTSSTRCRRATDAPRLVRPPEVPSAAITTPAVAQPTRYRRETPVAS